MNPALIHSFKAAKRITALHAKSFYFSSFSLPIEKRQAAFAVYAFCRFADDLVDEESLQFDLQLSGFETRMEFLDQILNIAYVTQKDLNTSFNTETIPWFFAFCTTVQRYQIPRNYFEDLLIGFRKDLNFDGILNDEQLSNYCYLVAGVVGLIMTRIFEMTSEQSQEAKALGEAMQLTNIVRDVREDFALRGRVYIPQNILNDFDVSHDDIARLGSPLASYKDALKVWPVIQRMIDKAKSQYLLAEQGLPFIPPDGSRLCAELMYRTYRGILEQIEKKGASALFERQKLSFFAKLEKIPVAIYRQNFSQSDINI